MRNSLIRKVSTFSTYLRYKRLLNNESLNLINDEIKIPSRWSLLIQELLSSNFDQTPSTFEEAAFLLEFHGSSLALQASNSICEKRYEKIVCIYTSYFISGSIRPSLPIDYLTISKYKFYEVEKIRDLIVSGQINLLNELMRKKRPLSLQDILLLLPLHQFNSSHGPIFKIAFSAFFINRPTSLKDLELWLFFQLHFDEFMVESVTIALTILNHEIRSTNNIDEIKSIINVLHYLNTKIKELDENNKESKALKNASIALLSSYIENKENVNNKIQLKELSMSELLKEFMKNSFEKECIENKFDITSAVATIRLYGLIYEILNIEYELGNKEYLKEHWEKSLGFSDSLRILLNTKKMQSTSIKQKNSEFINEIITPAHTYVETILSKLEEHCVETLKNKRNVELLSNPLHEEYLLKKCNKNLLKCIKKIEFKLENLIDVLDMLRQDSVFRKCLTDIGIRSFLVKPAAFHPLSKYPCEDSFTFEIQNRSLEINLLSIHSPKKRLSFKHFSSSKHSISLKDFNTAIRLINRFYNLE